MCICELLRVATLALAAITLYWPPCFSTPVFFYSSHPARKFNMTRAKGTRKPAAEPFSEPVDPQNPSRKNNTYYQRYVPCTHKLSQLPPTCTFHWCVFKECRSSARVPDPIQQDPSCYSSKGREKGAPENAREQTGGVGGESSVSITGYSYNGSSM